MFIAYSDKQRDTVTIPWDPMKPLLHGIPEHGGTLDELDPFPDSMMLLREMERVVSEFSPLDERAGKPFENNRIQAKRLIAARIELVSERTEDEH